MTRCRNGIFSEHLFDEEDEIYLPTLVLCMMRVRYLPGIVHDVDEIPT